MTEGIATPRNAAVEFHDSDIASIEIAGAVVAIRFDQAYVHRSDGVPGRDSGSGWAQAAILILSGVVPFEHVLQTSGTLTDGTVRLGEQEYRDLIPVPLSYSGDTSLSLCFDNGFKVQFRGSSLDFQLVSDPIYIEECPRDDASPSSK
jgi:hypothetical protein